MKFKVALLQISPLGDNQDKNLEKGLRACREAKALGADLALFPSFGILALLFPHAIRKDGVAG